MSADNNLPEAKNIMETKSGLIPTNIAEAMQLSEILAKSEIVPTDFRGKPSNIFVAVNWGIEIGLSPMQSLQSIAVINGRPSIWGDSALALVRGSGKLESIKETQTETEATCTVKRVGEPEVTTRFTMADANKAGLVNRSPVWKAYPKRMLQMRARSFALRDVFTDVLKGIGIVEEVKDSIDVEAESPSPVEAPKVEAETTTVNLKNNEPEVTEAVIDEPELETPTVVTVDDIKALYKEADTETKAKITGVLPKDWRTNTPEQLSELLTKIKAL